MRHRFMSYCSPFYLTSSNCFEPLSPWPKEAFVIVQKWCCYLLSLQLVSLTGDFSYGSVKVVFTNSHFSSPDYIFNSFVQIIWFTPPQDESFCNMRLLYMQIDVSCISDRIAIVSPGCPCSINAVCYLCIHCNRYYYLFLKIKPLIFYVTLASFFDVMLGLPLGDFFYSSRIYLIACCQYL